jgi:hypothetical protein
MDIPNHTILPTSRRAFYTFVVSPELEWVYSFARLIRRTWRKGSRALFVVEKVWPSILATEEPNCERAQRIGDLC